MGEGMRNLSVVLTVLYDDVLQYAGKSLKELQKALKNPLSNMGALTGAATKRAKRSGI